MSDLLVMIFDYQLSNVMISWKDDRMSNIEFNWIFLDAPPILSTPSKRTGFSLLKVLDIGNLVEVLFNRKITSENSCRCTCLIISVSASSSSSTVKGLHGIFLFSKTSFTRSSHAMDTFNFSQLEHLQNLSCNE